MKQKEDPFVVVHYYSSRLSSEPFRAIDWPKNVPLPQLGCTIGSYVKDGKYAHYKVRNIKYVLNNDNTVLEVVINAYQIM